MGHSVGIDYATVSVMFGVGLVMLWLLLAGYSVKSLSADALLSLTGHLRTPPEPWLENALRNAFAEFDRELAAILHDRCNPVWPVEGPWAQPAGSVDPESDAS
ncbi:hypothetical protein [Trebonia sp.]|uniref:hypothetical protein n=1 Tax=Trebonia sp. TaxID=2767075 RepID=UPI002629584B|nr:hypothetical protein [Trebonia sp.]